MGTSRSVADFSRKLGAAADAARDAKGPSMKRAAGRAKAEVEGARNKAVGSDGRFSKSGLRFGVGYNLGATTTRETALVYARGPWGMIEGGTRPHALTSRYGGSTRRRRQERASFVGPQLAGGGGRKAGKRAILGRTSGGRRAVMQIPGVGFRRSAHHPGTRGKRAWTKGRQQAYRAVPKMLGDPIAAAVREVFR